jgi:ERCC4-type nuclease
MRGTLTSCDYSVKGLEELFSIERKSVSDLVACYIGETRQRVERKLHRLQGYRFKRLLVVGSELEIEQGYYGSRIRPASVLGSLSAWEVRFDLPIVYRS